MLVVQFNNLFHHVQSLLAIIFVIPGDIGTLLDFFGFTTSIFYCASMVALIVMRFTKKNEYRPIKVPLCSMNIFPVAFTNFIFIGTYCHSINRNGNFGFSSNRTHRRRSKNTIFLRSLLHSRWTYFLRPFRLFQENDTGNGYIGSIA